MIIFQLTRILQCVTKIGHGNDFGTGLGPCPSLQHRLVMAWSFPVLDEIEFCMLFQVALGFIKLQSLQVFQSYFDPGTTGKPDGDLSKTECGSPYKV